MAQKASAQKITANRLIRSFGPARSCCHLILNSIVLILQALTLALVPPISLILLSLLRLILAPPYPRHHHPVGVESL